MTSSATLLLSRSDVAALLSLDDCVDAVEGAFRMAGLGLAAPPGILGVPARDGGFHIKAALLDLSRPYFAAKLNGNFRGNRERFGLPTIQGVIALFDGENGRPLALMDSIEITLLRTAAATAVAAPVSGPPRFEESPSCAAAARRAGSSCGRSPACFRSSGSTPATRTRRPPSGFARELAPRLGLEITPAAEPGPALRRSDVGVTCTTSRRAFLRDEDVPPGMFLAAVGADSPDKQELDPAILRRARLFVDSREQCATIGEWHHALADGSGPSPEATELAEVVAGAKPGRLSPEEVTVFDSTGIALEDVAAAAAVYEKAVATGRGGAWSISDSDPR